MEVKELIKKFEVVGEREVVGAMVYYTNKGESYKQVNYFYNPTLEVEKEDLENHITKDLAESVAFDTYEIEYDFMASKGLIIADYKEISFKELLSSEVVDVKFYEVKELV